MTCMEAQSLITPFINDKLTILELEQFLKHVNQCPDCMEELEVYFALLTAMKQLDEDEDVLLNIKLALANKLKESEDKILHEKIVHIRKRVIFFLVVCMIGIVSSWSVGVMENVVSMSEEDKFNYFSLNYQQLDQYVDQPLGRKIVSYKELQEEITSQKELKEEEEKLQKEEELRKQSILYKVGKVPAKKRVKNRDTKKERIHE